MNLRMLLRWMVSIVIAVGLLGVIGLALNSPVQARVALVYDWPGVSLPCNASLQECIDAAVVQPGDTIRIKPGIYTQSVTLAKPVSLIGDGRATSVLNAEPGQRVLTVTGSISFTTVISGLTFKDGNAAGSVCPDACGGGMLLAGTARPTLQNIALVSNTAAWQGGGLWVEGGPDLKLVNAVFISNTADSDGGGLYFNGPVQLVDGRFEHNSALGFGGGGGLFVGGLQANGTEFTGNTTNKPTAYGGGAYVSAGAADLNLVQFQDNSTAGAGGALYVSGPVTLTKAHFINNQAELTGGGVYAGGTLFLLDSRLENNVSRSSSGGGAFTQSSAVIIDSVVVSNSAALQGGGLQAEAGANLLRAEFVRNVGVQRGGGLDVAGSLDIMRSIFVSNTSAIAGGVFHTAGGDGRVVNSLFVRNVTSDTSASALHLASTGHVDVIHTTIADPTGLPYNSAAAIQLESGSLNITNTIIADHAVGVFNNGATAVEDYNLFSNVGMIASGQVISGGHDQYPAAPQFVDPAVDNYHLRFTSDAIDNGTDAGVYLDIDGQPRPIGVGFDIGFDETGLSIQQLIDMTPPGGTVNIPAGVYTESLTLNKPVSLIGAGSGSTTINAAPNDRVLTVTGIAILPNTQIVSLTLQGGHLVTDTCSGFCGGGGVLIAEGASPSFRNVVIKDNQAMMGGGLYLQLGSAQLFDSLVTGNQALQSGGGAYVEAASAILEQIGGTFGANRAIDGAGVFVQAGLFKQTGGVIYNNVASHWGGGMLIGSGGAIRTAQGQIISNSAANSGGGLFVDVGTAELRDSLIENNSAYDGGGIFVRDWPGTGAAIIGGKLEGNFADATGGYGGGVYVGGTLHITGTRVSENSAYDGSAVRVGDAGQARIVNAFIVGNRAVGAFPSTNSSVRFDSSGDSVVLHTTFGNNATQVYTRALTVNSGVVTVSNTIVANFTTGLSQFGGYLREDYNLYFGTAVTSTGSISHGAHSLIGLDPLFLNPLNGDYHIKGLSPAVNRGAHVGVLRDVDLDPRPLGGGFDIGADEASVAGVQPGPGTGGSLIYTTTQNSTINLVVPPGAVTQTTPIYCSLIASNTLPTPSGLSFAGVLFELEAQLDPLNNSTPGSINFNVPVTLTVSYTDAELAAAGIDDELTVQLYRFETSINEWRPIGYQPGETQTLDVDNNLITATVLGLSKFGRMGATSGFEIFLPLVSRGN